MPFIDSILWATDHLNLKALQKFNDTMNMYFASYFVLNEFNDVNKELRECFKNEIPDFYEINKYMI